jgi:hypothetical protein
MGTAPYQFFYVTASTEADGTKMALPTQLKPARASKEKAIRGEAPNPITRIIQATVK